MTKRRQRVQLVIADSQPVFLQGLSNVFRSRPEIKIVAQCEDGLAAMAAIREHAPDIAMVDASMPGFSGFDVLAAVTAENLSTGVIFLTASLSDPQIVDAISRGAKGVVFKNSSAEEIARSVRKVAAGKYQFPKDLAHAMRSRRSKRQKASHSAGRRLTPRELEVTRLVTKGLTNKEIGQQMDLKEGTVKIHLHNIFKKLSLANRTSLATLMLNR
jgi:two-component system nitrate/nitrite response regulator NarL